MRRWLDFAGGLLVGFGVAAYVFLVWLTYWLHHLFVMGITQPFATVALLSLPAFSILLGIAVMTLRKKAA